MPLANHKQVVGLGGYRPCSSYHKTTVLLTLIVVVDRFLGFGLEVFYYFGLESKQQKCNYVKSRQQFCRNGWWPRLKLKSLIRVLPHTQKVTLQYGCGGTFIEIQHSSEIQQILKYFLYTAYTFS